MHAYRPTHYEALGVPRSADAEAIRTAYRAQAKQLHPDLSDGSQSNEAFLHLQEAYDVLRDPERRAHYDDELAQQAAMAQAARLAARLAARPPPPVRRPPPRPLLSRLWGLRAYLAAVGLVVTVTVGIVTWQLLFEPEPQPVMIVKVDRDDRARPVRGSGGTASGVGAADLTREADRLQAQVERVEAAKKRMEAQLSELEAHKPAPNAGASNGGSGGKTPALLASRVQCTGRGTNIVLTRDKDVTKVSYDNGPAVQPRISDLGTGTVLVSRIEPTNKMAISFTRGDRTGTTLLMFDEAGKVLQTFTIECTVAAF